MTTPNEPAPALAEAIKRREAAEHLAGVYDQISRKMAETRRLREKLRTDVGVRLPVFDLLTYRSHYASQIAAAKAETARRDVVVHQQREFGLRYDCRPLLTLAKGGR